MFESGANHTKVLDNILQAANKHPNSRVSKLIHNVEEERSQKNIVLLLIELAEHPEYSTDFGISLRYYLDLFEQLGMGRDIVLNEAGLLLLNSSKVYGRRVDFVQELVERQILTLSNTEKEMVDNRPENTIQNLAEKPKRSRKRLVEAVNDPYEVELVPRKFRKLAEGKRFGGTSQQEKTKVAASKFYKIESEQYIHPAAWMHASIVDLENDEEIDSKRNYKLFTYHVEHRYNTLVPDINFRLHFKVKDYMDEEEERLSQIEDRDTIDGPNDLSDWPPLSEEYIEKYLDLENKVLAIGEVLRHRKKPRLGDILINRHNESKTKETSQLVQNSNECYDSNIEGVRDLTDCIQDSNIDLIALDSGIDSSVSLNNTSAFDTSTNANESALCGGSSIHEGLARNESDLSITNLTAPDSSLELTQNLNSTEKSLLESSNETENSIEASNIATQSELTASNVNENSNTFNENDSNCSQISTQQLRDDTGLGESINEKTNQLNESPSNLTNNKGDEVTTSATTIDNSENHMESDSKQEAEIVEAKAHSGNTADQNGAENEEKIRVYLPHLDDEGVYFSDLDDHDHRMLSPKVLTTDVFPCIPNKENITIFVDDEIKTLLNIVEDEEPPITYTMPVQIVPPTPPLVLNILKFHEKVLRRRVLFKLGPEMDLFLQSRSMKRTHNVDMNETRQYRPMKLFSNTPDISTDRNESGMRSTSATNCNIFSDDEDAEDFLGFTEEEQANTITHRLSRDSGVDDADVLLTPPFTSSLKVINEDFNEATTQQQEQKNAGDSSAEIAVNDEKVEENISLQGVESCVGVLENALAADTTPQSIDNTTVITNDVATNDNCADEESTQTTPTALIDSSLNENIAAVIDDNNTNLLEHENDLDDDTTFRDSGLFTQDDLLDMDNIQEVEKSKTKIQKWHEYLQPILSKARYRHHFDVFQLGTEIMNELQKPIPSAMHITSSSITFQDVMTAKDESYVSRYFLSTLLLANQNNIKINVINKCTEKPSTWDDIKLDLLDTKRHTVAIEDNIGIINNIHNTTETTKRKQKKSSIINEARYSSSSTRIDENHVINSEMLNVNINVVRPLKPIEKLPNTNDDYDSGIFSNEECMS